MIAPKNEELIEGESALAEDIELSAKVWLFNDEVHDFEEVILQIMKAAHCSSSDAEALTWKVHSEGKAIVFVGDFGECLLVSAVLEEINLGTQIEY